MIEKIQHIQNVGRLRKSGGTSSVYNLARNTIIYAGNTHGKSTFTAITRSLAENKDDFIVGRKTFGSTSPQQVILKINGNLHKFNNSGWNNPHNKIRIFDTRYIHESFFSPDEEITNDGQKKIETFILGTEGVRLAKTVVDLTAEQRENSSKMRGISTEYGAQKGFDEPNFDTFLDTNEVENVENLIDETVNVLNSYKNQASIQSQLETLMLSLEEPDFSGCQTSLQDKLTVDISQITDHISNNIRQDASALEAKEFLRSGFKLRKDDHACPFCAQDISPDSDNANLIHSYSEYFSDSYNTMANARQTYESFFNSWGIVSILRKGVIELSKINVEIDLKDADDRIESSLNQLKIELENKKDFSYPFNFEPLGLIKTECSKLLIVLKEIKNQYEGDLSKKITDGKLILAQYELAKKRHGEPWKTKCAEYSEAKKLNDDTVTPKLTAAIEAQSAYATSLYGSCMDSVNNCLNALGANFKVDNLVYRGRGRNDLFSLIFDDTHAVGITSASRVSTHTSKHTLSESDRRALCFAFFIASALNDTDLQNLILILDDPVSSFDFERRNNTAKYLKKVQDGSIGQPKQLIILTHDREFFKTICLEINDDVKSLILEWSHTDNTSDFAEIDSVSNKLFMSDYHRKLHELEECLLLSDSQLNTGHLLNIRFLLENVMKRKYYRLLLDDIKSKGSVEAFITTLSQPDRPYANSQQLLSDIRALSPHTVHHDQDNPGGYSPDGVGPADIRRLIREGLAIIERL